MVFAWIAADYFSSDQQIDSNKTAHSCTVLLAAHELAGIVAKLTTVSIYECYSKGRHRLTRWPGSEGENWLIILRASLWPSTIQTQAQNMTQRTFWQSSDCYVLRQTKDLSFCNMKLLCV